MIILSDYVVSIGVDSPLYRSTNLHLACPERIENPGKYIIPIWDKTLYLLLRAVYRDSVCKAVTIVVFFFKIFYKEIHSIFLVELFYFSTASPHFEYEFKF